MQPPQHMEMLFHSLKAPSPTALSLVAGRVPFGKSGCLCVHLQRSEVKRTSSQGLAPPELHRAQRVWVESRAAGGSEAESEAFVACV